MQSLDKDKFSDTPSYIKLIFPNKKEIEISPLNKMEEAFQKSNEVSLTRFEFIKKKKGLPPYPYIFSVGNYFFDLTEKMAIKMAERANIKIQSYS